MSFVLNPLEIDSPHATPDLRFPKYWFPKYWFPNYWFPNYWSPKYWFPMYWFRSFTPSRIFSEHSKQTAMLAMLFCYLKEKGNNFIYKIENMCITFRTL